jgi:hypothetical protein
MMMLCITQDYISGQRSFGSDYFVTIMRKIMISYEVFNIPFLSSFLLSFHENSSSVNSNELSVKLEEIARILSKENGEIPFVKLRFFANLLQQNFPKLLPEEEYSQLRIFSLLQRSGALS